jgi:hypothetical protein
MTGIWRPVPGYEGRYEVSDHGQVRNATGRVLRQGFTEFGYRTVSLSADGSRKTCRVHRLVLTTFDRPPTADEVTRHLDGDPSNNVRSNLCWGTQSENCRDMLSHGTHNTGSATHCSSGHKFTPENTLHIKRSAGDKDQGPRRVCRTCNRTRITDWYHRRKDSTAARPVTCSACGATVRRDCLPRHTRRHHLAGAA